jgi:ribosomal protein L32
MEHMTFLTDYDYLGGICFQMNRKGQVDVEFFEHLESLPCYNRKFQDHIREGTLPPMLDVDRSYGEIRNINHVCHECEHYSKREKLSSHLMHSSVASLMPFSYTFEDGRRTLTIVVENVKDDDDSGVQMPRIEAEFTSCNGVSFTRKEKIIMERMFGKQFPSCASSRRS